ncbi:MAG: C40 family peptidase [Taibaiella sp.]|nr:C40 family peptidase [Taibaiella sp.]
MVTLLVASCQTGKKVASNSKYSRQPKFINGIYLDGHNKTTAKTNAISTKKGLPTPITVKEEQKTIEKTELDVAPNPVAAAREEKTEPVSFDLVSDNLVGNKYAEMIGLDHNVTSNKQLYRFIDKWHGTNYRYGGQTIAGIDCSGFSQKLYDEVYHIELTRTAQDQYNNSKREKKADSAEEGDLVFFRERGKRITHVGVYLANKYFIHSSTSSGVMISNLDEEHWHKQFVGIGKMPKTE